MDYEVFMNENNKSIVVITEWGDKQPNKENAIRYTASRYFKCKQDKLECGVVYMKNNNADIIYFDKKKNMKGYLAVWRK